MLERTVYITAPGPDKTEPTPTISGRSLTHGKRTKIERALLMADLHLDRCRLTNPTITQCAVLGHVCGQYIAAAIDIADDEAARAAVLAGDRTLLDAKTVAPETLAERFARATPSERLTCARAVGPAAVWDHMIAPLV
jgi:hypothetical protein